MLTQQVRATIYNIFRIPLNFIVVVVLANLKSLHDDLVFTLCACFLALAAVLQVHTQRCTLCACCYVYTALFYVYTALHTLRLLFGVCSFACACLSGARQDVSSLDVSKTSAVWRVLAF